MTRARPRAARRRAGLNWPGVVPPGHEPEELQHDHERARRGLGQRESGDGLLRRHPAQCFDEVRRDVPEHGIGAAERDQRRLGEKDIHRRPERLEPERCRQAAARAAPTRRGRPRACAACSRACRGGLQPRAPRCGVRQCHGRPEPRHAATSKTQGNGTPAFERDERAQRERNVQWPAQRASPDAQRAPAPTSAITAACKPEQHARDPGQRAVRGVDVRTARRAARSPAG